MKQTIAVFDPYIAMAYWHQHCPADVQLVGFTFPVEPGNEFLARRMQPRFFAATYSLTGDLEADIALVQEADKTYGFSDYLVGFEGNLTYLEQLIFAVGGQSYNRPETSVVRASKWAMQMALERAGLNAIHSLSVSAQQPLEPGALQGFEYPVVVKPSTGSGGSFGFNICHSQVECETAIAALLGEANAFSVAVEEVVVQEFIEGDEYVFDATVNNGEIKISGLFRYYKELIRGKPIYRSLEMIALDREPEMVAYAIQAIKALDYRHGFAHMELFKTKQGKPYLIELNPRASGGYGCINWLARTLMGADQISLYFNQPPSVETKRYGRVLYLQNFGFGSTALDCEKIQALPSCADVITVNPKNAPGQYPNSLDDITAFLLLCNDNKEALDADMQTIFNYEKIGEIFL